jgi:citrate synthase
MGARTDGSSTALPALSETVGDDIFIRGRDVAHDLVGHVTFTEAMLLELRGVPPTPGQVRVVDGVLVAIMEHGLTPSALATRLVHDAAPEALQGAVAAGLLGSGTRFLGAMREAAVLLDTVSADDGAGTDLEHARAEIARRLDAGERLPGFGHNLHGTVDPRVEALRALARDADVAGRSCEVYAAVMAAVHEARPELIPNAAGAVAAVLRDAGISAEETRGFALIARCAGLVAHVSDERANPRARQIWESVV